MGDVQHPERGAEPKRLHSLSSRRQPVSKALRSAISLCVRGLVDPSAWSDQMVNDVAYVQAGIDRDRGPR